MLCNNPHLHSTNMTNNGRIVKKGIIKKCKSKFSNYYAISKYLYTLRLLSEEKVHMLNRFYKENKYKLLLKSQKTYLKIRTHYVTTSFFLFPLPKIISHTCFLELQYLQYLSIEEMKGLELRKGNKKLTLANYKSKMSQQNEIQKIAQNPNMVNTKLETFCSQKSSSVNLGQSKLNIPQYTRLTPNLICLPSHYSIFNPNFLKRSFSEKQKKRGFSMKLRENQASKAKSIKGNQQKYTDDFLDALRENTAQLILLLKRQQILNEINYPNYIVNKQAMQQLLIYTISNLMGIQLNQTYKFNKKLRSLANPLAKIRKTVHQNQQKLKEKTLCCSSNLTIFKYSSCDYERQIRQHKMGIQTLLQIKEHLHQQIKQHQYKISKLHSQLDPSYSLDEDSSKQQSISLSIQLALDEHQQQLNYVSHQISYQFKLFNQTYLQLQQEIRDAIVLQSSASAQYLQYFPNSFSSIFINRIITQDLTRQISKNSPIMDDFVESTMRKFSKKTNQFLKIMQFKRNLISQFLDKTKKWLQKSALKKQCLANIHNLFFTNIGSSRNATGFFSQGQNYKGQKSIKV